MQFRNPFPRRRSARKPVPVLTYHGLHAPGTDYSNNDHVALEEDLKVIRSLGFKVAPLTEIARITWGGAAPSLDAGYWVGLSFDDGTDYDYLDVDHPHLGYIKSFYTILQESGASHARHWPQPTGVSFVIASPEARGVLDRTCIAGQNNWRDTWWAEAARTQILEIGNHSWDHTHPTLDVVAQRDQQKGTFFGINNLQDADVQVCQSEDYIRSRTGDLTTGLFAYPYGEASDYLVNEYFPRFKRRHRIVAAFATGGDYVTPGSNRWKIPRFMCGEHWKSPDELAAILLEAKKG